MTAEKAKKIMDTFYLARRIHGMLPPLPDGVAPSYIQILGAIELIEEKKIRACVSNISDYLNLPLSGITRTVKEMEKQGYIQKSLSEKDKRIVYIRD